MRDKRNHITFLGVLLGFLIAFPLLAGAALLYLRFGPVPVATADAPFPDEQGLVDIALNARIQRQMTTSPIPATPGNLLGGAHVYVVRCAVCHGTPNEKSSFAQWEYPTAPQLWIGHGNGVVGVSNDPAGASYWKVANGIRLTGMPSFQHLLTTTEMWQVALLLQQANHPLPPAIAQVFAQADTLRAQSQSMEAATPPSSNTPGR